MASQDLLRWRLKRRRRGRYSRNNTQWGIWLILIFLTWNIDSKMHKEETRQTIEITLWQLDFTRKILLRWRQRRPRRSSRNKHSVGLVNFHISYLSLTIFFFSWNWLVTKWLLHFDEFFDETKHCARFQQETRQDALIALGQHVFTRKIILISYTSVSVSALISLRAPSKTNNLKCSYEKAT